ncbi:MAG: pilus assembly protein [Acidimicrobiia bacterium]|nr:pilus assembly protein [Acidimicrobiia bacterium]
MAIGRRRRRLSDDGGAVLVEFALVFGLFVLLVLGMVDFGLGINAKTQITNAGREGARLGTVNLDSTDVEARVRDAVTSLDMANLVVTVACAEKDTAGPCGGTGDLSNGREGDTVTVTVDYDYDLVTPLPGFLGVGSSLALQSVTEMRIE